MRREGATSGNAKNSRSSFYARLPYGVKLGILISGVVILSIVSLTSLNLVQVTGSLEDVGKRSIKSSAISLADSIFIQRNMSRRQLDASLQYARKLLLSGTILASRKTDQVSVFDPETNNEETRELQRIYSSGDQLGQGENLEEVVARFGGFCAIYQYDKGDLVPLKRVAAEGEELPEIIPYISAGSDQAASMLESTEIHKEDIGGVRYLVGYHAFRLAQTDEYAGVIAVGRPLLSQDIASLIESSTIEGQGFTLLLDQNGSVLATSAGAPSLDGSILKDIVAQKDSFHSFKVGGDNDTIFGKFFEPWQWHIVVGMSSDNMLQGADTKFYQVNLIACAVLLLLAGLALWFIMRVSSGPLKKINSFASEVASGNYGASLEYCANDVIGETIGGVCSMVGDLKTKLGFSNGLLMGLTQPCIVVDTEEEVTFINQEYLDLFGFPGAPDDYAEKKLNEVFKNNSSNTVSMGQTMSDGVSHRDQEVELNTQDGRELFIRFDMAPLYDLDKNLIGGFLLITDLTRARENQRLIETKNQAIEASADKANQISQQMLRARDELATNVSVSISGSEKQKDRTAQTAVAMEQMNETVREVAQNAASLSSSADESMAKAHEGAQIVDSLIKRIGDSEDQANSLVQNMNELGNQAEGIGRIINVINDIADQTNLLALNAAIEAARAGEAGRGFAVVADEVRKLAEKTMSATNEVDSFIRSIQDSIQANVGGVRSTVTSMSESAELARQSGSVLDKIVSSVEETTEKIRSIATAAEEQSATTQEITASADAVQRIANETAQAMTLSEKALEGMSEVITELAEVIEDMRS